jgi:hypothetical protein
MNDGSELQPAAAPGALQTRRIDEDVRPNNGDALFDAGFTSPGPAHTAAPGAGGPRRVM